MIVKNSTPLVSICCITYNQHVHIRDTIEGFLLQKVNFPIEIIIHDDASTDGTAKIIQEYAAQYPEIFVSIIQKENQWSKGGGSIYARFVFPRARGKYIALCEGDDYWTDPYKLQKQVDFLEENPDYSACFTNALIVNELDNTERVFLNDLREGAIDIKTVIIQGGGLYPTASLLYRKDSIDFDVFNKITQLAGDDLLIMSLGMAGNIYFLNEKTCIYRRWGGGVWSSISGNKIRNVELKKTQIEGYKRLLKFADKKFIRHIKRKISLTAFYIIRRDNIFKTYRYLQFLHPKELFRLFTALK